MTDEQTQTPSFSEEVTEDFATPSSPSDAKLAFISLIRMAQINIKVSPREMALVRTKLQEALMWFNEALVPKASEVEFHDRDTKTN